MAPVPKTSAIARVYGFSGVVTTRWVTPRWVARGTVKILVVILTTIPWLIFNSTWSSLPLDDTVVTHVISIGNWNLRDESVVTNDEPIVK